MSVVKEPEVAWSPDQMIEVTLNEPDDFLKVRETLTRIGVASRKEKKIYQSCHILHKQGRYYLVHFKELYRDYISDDIDARLSAAGFEGITAETHFMTRVWSARKPIAEAS